MTGRSLDALTGWHRVAASVAIGGAIGLGQAPFSLFWAAVPALILSILQFAASLNPRDAFRIGMAIGAGYVLVAMNWIVEPFFVDIVRHGLLAPFALGSMAVGFGLFWGAGFWLARWLAIGSLGNWALVLAWTATEVARSYVFTGFPWGLISFIWINTPIYQFAAYLGPHGLTMATLVLCVLAVSAWQAKRRVALVVGLIAVVVALSTVGWWIQSTPVPSDGGKRAIVRLIQPNANQRQKWDPEMMPVFYRRQINLTEEPSDVAPDLVVWPEVAVPFLLNDETAPFWEIAGAAGDATVILGAQRLVGSAAYNSVGVLDRDGSVTAVYDKHHLVPLGEYLPFAETMNELGLQALTAQYGYAFSPGTGPATLDLGPLGHALPLICYEGVFPHEMRRAPGRADWLLLVTNDAWFGQLSGPYQHLALAQARSIEFGLPMVRAANTGVSAVIDARGQITGQIPMGVAGRIDLALPPPLPPTVYVKLGDWPVLVLLALGVAVLSARKYRLTMF